MNNKWVKVIGAVVAIAIVGFFALNFFKTEDIVEDYNNYRNVVQEAALKAVEGTNELNDLSLSADFSTEEFSNSYKENVLKTFEESISILEKEEPKTEEVKEFKKIIVNAFKKQHSLLEDLLVAFENNDIDEINKINGKLSESTEKVEKEILDFQKKLEDEYSVEFENE